MSSERKGCKDRIAATSCSQRHVFESRPRTRILCRFAAALAVAATVPALAGAATVQAPPDGLYVALGPSTTAGWGAGLARRGYVELHFGYLRSIGAADDFRNLGTAGATTADIRERQLPAAVTYIDAASDTKLVTIDICCNDVRQSCLGVPLSDPRCLVAANLRAIVDALNAALARDPGDETVKVIESPLLQGVPAAETLNPILVGVDGRVDCSASGADVGMNDLARCIALEKGATPVAVPRLGPGEFADDAFGGHPNPAGHRVIAQALGGAVELQPEPAPPVARCIVPNVVGMPLTRARRAIAAVGCRTGRVRRVASAAPRNVVVRQSPRAGARLPRLGTVGLVVSRGR